MIALVNKLRGSFRLISMLCFFVKFNVPIDDTAPVISVSCGSGWVSLLCNRSVWALLNPISLILFHVLPIIILIRLSLSVSIFYNCPQIILIPIPFHSHLHASFCNCSISHLFSCHFLNWLHFIYVRSTEFCFHRSITLQAIITVINHNFKIWVVFFDN